MPTINDLHVLLVEQKGDLKALLSKMEDLSKRQDNHETDDKGTHKDLHARITTIKKFGGIISAISIGIGYIIGMKFK